jgi:hypothetical protein
MDTASSEHCCQRGTASLTRDPSPSSPSAHLRSCCTRTLTLRPPVPSCGPLLPGGAPSVRRQLLPRGPCKPRRLVGVVRLDRAPHVGPWPTTASSRLDPVDFSPPLLRTGGTPVVVCGGWRRRTWRRETYIRVGRRGQRVSPGRPRDGAVRRHPSLDQPPPRLPTTVSLLTQTQQWECGLQKEVCEWVSAHTLEPLTFKDVSPHRTTHRSWKRSNSPLDLCKKLSPTGIEPVTSGGLKGSSTLCRSCLATDLALGLFE